MKGRNTDHRNINLRQLNIDILQKKAGKKVLFQPRILSWYYDREFSKIPLPHPYTGMSVHQLYKALGCSNRIYDYNAAFVCKEDASIRRSREKLDALRTRLTIETPVGSVFAIERANVSNYGVYNEKWYIENEEDMKVMMYVDMHTAWQWDQAAYDRVEATWGDNGEGSVYFPRVSLQRLFLETAGIENTIYALNDFPDLCEAYLKILHEKDMETCRMLADTPLIWINFGDNVHGGVLPPNLFAKYVLPEYQARNEILQAAGKYTFAHWDGDTKPLLPFAKESGLNGIEAITPVPQGDVTIEEIKAALGDTVDLIDGIPAIFFDEIYPVEQLKETTQRLLDLFPGQLILGISDEMSSTGNIDRIQTVMELVDNHNAKH